MVKKINIALIHKLNIFVDLSKTFLIVVRNFDEELISRKQILQKIQQTQQKQKQIKTITIQYSLKEDIFALFQKFVKLYIDTIILPLVEQIPNNENLLKQVDFLNRANDNLVPTKFTINDIKMYIKKFSKPLRYNIILEKK